MSDEKQKRVLLAGGGTLGSVSPLLALIPVLQQQNADLRWIGTRNGPERTLIEKKGVQFSWIATAKLHRFATPRLLIQPFAFMVAIAQAKWKLLTWRPDVIVSAAGFTAVPLVIVGWFFRIPSVIHQQDIRPSLSNRIMAPFATAITVAFEASLEHFGTKAVWTGNPVRDLTATTNSISIDSAYPTILITGGGTGAQALNELVTAQLCDFANVIHLTGKGRTGNMEPIQHERYHQFDLLGEEMKEALEKADVVVARAGLGTMSELAALKKPAIIMPMPDTHQEDNARVLAEQSAAIIVNQRSIKPEYFVEEVQRVVESKKIQKHLSEHIQAFYKADAIEHMQSVIAEV